MLKVETGCREGLVFARISDTGAGIDPEILDDIFEPFFGDKGLLATGKKGYAGLGLFTASGIINNFGGEIKVESKPGFGASFSVILPVPPAYHQERERKEATAASEEVEPRDGQPEKGKILCVDDEEFIAENLRNYLLGRGYVVDIALNGPAAIEKVRDTDYDVILMDLVMPEMNGEATINKILELRPSARFVAISGYSPFNLSEPAAKKVSAFLQKPFPMDRLAIAVRNAMREGDSNR